MKRNVILLGLISFFNDIASEMVYPLLPLYISALGYGTFYIGFLEGLSEFLLATSQAFFGYWSDYKKNRKLFVRWGYFFSVVSKPLYVLWQEAFWVLFCRLFDRLGKGVRTAARDALLAENSEKETVGKVFGYHRAMDTAGAIAGPLISLILGTYLSLNITHFFLLAFIPGFLAVSLAFLLQEEQKTSAEKKIFNLKNFFSYYKKAPTSLRRLLMVFWLFSFVQGSPFFIFLWLQHLGNSKEKILMGYLIYNLVYGVLAFPFGLLADRISHRRVFFFGGLAFLASYLIFLFLQNEMGFFLGFLFYGLFSALTVATKKAWFSYHLNSRQKATAFGFLATGDAIALLLGQSFLGFLWDTLSPQVSLFSSLFGVLFCLIFTWIFTKKID